MTPPPAPAQNRLEHFPIPFFAMVMGLSGTALALHAAEQHSGSEPIASQLILALAVGAFVILAGFYALKAIRYPGAVVAEWRHPVKLSFFPALTISILLIATAIRAMSMDVARVLWIIGTIGQAGLTLAVLSNWIGHRTFQTMHISPAWFIPAVGNVIVPVAGVSFGFVETSWVFFSAGIIFWLVLLVLVMNRLIFHDPLPARMVPTVAILIAPPAVAFLSWLQLNGGVLDGAARLLYGMTLVFAALALTQVMKLKGLPFALSWWALSFPVAALTIATFRFAELAKSSVHANGAILALAVLLAIVATLLARTALAIRKREICQPE